MNVIKSFLFEGWASITPKDQNVVKMTAWTPEGRGIYLRKPALLPHAVRFRGRRFGGCEYTSNDPIYWGAHGNINF